MKLKVIYYVLMLIALVCLCIAGMYYAATGLGVGVGLNEIAEWRWRRRITRLGLDLRAIMNARSAREHEGSK